MNLPPSSTDAIAGAGLAAGPALCVGSAAVFSRPLRSVRTHQPDGVAAYPAPFGERGQFRGDDLKALHVFIFAPSQLVA